MLLFLQSSLPFLTLFICRPLSPFPGTRVSSFLWCHCPFSFSLGQSDEQGKRTEISWKNPNHINRQRKMASSSHSSNFPCAACKFLRRKCMPDCVFAPYFPPEEPQKFINVHKIFGASNVSKLINEVAPHQREDAVNSLAYEAEARLKDPVYGCVGAISILQRQVFRLQRELDAIHADLIRYATATCNCNEMPPPMGRTSFHHNSSCNIYYPNPHWNEPYEGNGRSDGGSL
ncbi:protein LATERAL ORGAN BOUNDARIES isoform X1 [Gossypium arboreum]|nr:protein LATERAL ORGAN BOUNDARIES isoform X1 [Gossypium arboreum]